MASTAARSGRLPRAALGLALPAVCAGLILAFVIALFPYERFRGATTARLRAATGAQVELGELSGGVSLGGVAVTARDLRMRWPDGKTLDLERARLRPAWSFSWLRGQPALGVDLEGTVGRVVGTWWPGQEGGFEGTVREAELDSLPVLTGPLPLSGGRANADVDLRLAGGEPRGTVDLEAVDGALATSALPMALPFERLVGHARLEEGGAIALQDVVLEGPMLAATASGNVGAAPRLALAPLDLDIEVEVVDAALRPMLRSSGVRLDANGRARLRITGTPDRPQVR